MEKLNHLRVTLVFIVTIVIPSVFLSGIAYQALETERLARGLDRAHALEDDARACARELDDDLRGPERALRRMAGGLRASARAPFDAIPALEELVKREPLLGPQVQVRDARGRRVYPAPSLAQAQVAPQPFAVASLGAPLPVEGASWLLAIDQCAREGRISRALGLSVRLAQSGDGPSRAGALLEEGRLRLRSNVAEDLRAARDDFARAAASPFEARDARGRPVALEAKIELALLEGHLGDRDVCTARLKSVLSEIEGRGALLPCDTAADLAERVGALLEHEGEAWAGERARAVSERRRRIESIHERWDDLFGRELQDAIGARRARERARAPSLPDGGAGGGSADARPRTERTATGWLKRRAGDRYEVLLYAIVDDVRDDAVAIAAVPVDLDVFAQETARARIAARARATTEGEDERPTFELVERKDDEPAPDPRAQVGRAALGFPLDHVEVRVTSAPPAEAAAADVSLLKQKERIKLWLITLSVAGIVAGALVTTRTVLREVKSAELKSDFVSNVTHELKTPLTSIRMFIETLEDGRVENEEEEKECLSIMKREADRLTRLIDRLLAFSKIESRKWRFKFGYIQPLELVEDSIRLLRQQVAQTEEALPIEVDCVQKLAPLAVDKDAIEEVLLNLLTNAYKYTPAPERRIKVVVTERRRRVEIAVEDNGIGVPRRDRRRIWKKFERGSNAEKGRFEGSGIGLTLALSIARAHGGTIWLTPLKPKGSRFTLSLPK